ncbi:MAG: hypothetical protein LBJ44_11640 [Propionibacteriaceae bacterium]|jgi:hypothetical protein|nr:hypothetical protein [Propionibacteriaceae bacterium]
MQTITLTEFNQNPSQATRLADIDEVVVLRRGRAAYRLERITGQASDPVEALVQAGLLIRAGRGDRPRARRLPVARTNVDLGAILSQDRDRLDG